MTPERRAAETAYWEDVAARYKKALERILSPDTDFLGEAHDIANEALSATQPFEADL